MSASGNYVPDQSFYNYAVPSAGIVAGRLKKYDTCVSLFSEFFWSENALASARYLPADVRA